MSFERKNAPSLRERSVAPRRHGRVFTVVAAFGWLALSGACATAEERAALRVATWNLENLRDENGEGQTPRIDGDYALLKLHAMEMDADVVAFQEVENAAAAERVFDPDDYVIVLSERRPGSDGQIRTGFAVRRGVAFERHPDYAALDVAGHGDLRYGVDIEVDLGDATLRLMSVHLKSYCFSPSAFREGSHCDTRLAQTAPLEAWIDARAEDGVPFAVLGDFNRRYDDPDDQEWEDLDDGEPAGAHLMRPDAGVRATCDARYPTFIDHIILDARAASMRVPETFREWTYGPVRRSDGDLPTDHCPLSVDLAD